VYTPARFKVYLDILPPSSAKLSHTCTHIRHLGLGTTIDMHIPGSPSLVWEATCPGAHQQLSAGFRPLSTAQASPCQPFDSTEGSAVERLGAAAGGSAAEQPAGPVRRLLQLQPDSHTMSPGL
jgi:hypothetical protein